MGIRYVYLLILALMTSAQFIYPNGCPSGNQVWPPPLNTLAQVPVWVVGSTYHIQWTLNSATAGMKLWSYDRNFYTVIFAAGYPNSGSYWWTVTFSEGQGTLDGPFGNIFYLALYEDGSKSATYTSTFIIITSPSAASISTTSTTFPMQSSTYLTTSDTSTSITSASSSSPRTLPQPYSSVTISAVTQVSVTESGSIESPFSQLSTILIPMSSSVTTCLKTSRVSAEISTLTLTISVTQAPSRNSSTTVHETQTELGTRLGIPLCAIFGVLVGLFIRTYLQKRKIKVDAEPSPSRIPNSTGTRHETPIGANLEAPDRSRTPTNSALVKARISRIGSMTLNEEIEMTSQDNLFSGNAIQGNYGEVPQGRAEVPGARGVEVDGAPMTADLIFVLKETLPVSS